MESQITTDDAWAALDWLADLGADEAIEDAPINRYDLPARQEKPAQNVVGQSKTPLASAPAPQQAAKNAAPDISMPVDNSALVAAAKQAAQAAADLGQLKAALENFEAPQLRMGARNTVFADGNPSAKVMIIGEAPGREEDHSGRPFVGQAGQLLDIMFAPLGLSRTAQTANDSIYITNLCPWRPTQNRDPRPDEIAVFMPFVMRHIELINPAVIVLMGNIPCQALLEQTGITRLRGNWADVNGCPTMPMLHPGYLLRKPAAKAESWRDLLALKSKLISLN